MPFQHHKAQLILSKPWGHPRHGPHTRVVMTDDEWQGAVAAGGVLNLIRYPLNALDPDALDEDKKRAVGMAYELGGLDDGADNRVSDWTQVVSPEERALRATLLANYRADLEALKAKQKPSDEELAHIKDLGLLVDEYSFGEANDKLGRGFLREAPGFFASGYTAISQTLAEPNVPKHLIWNKRIGKNRAWYLSGYLFAPHADQAEPTFRAEWDRFRFELKHGKDAKLFRFNTDYFDEAKRRRAPLTPALRQSFETQLDALLDLGRLTPLDNEFIKAQRHAVAGIKAAAKKNNYDGKLNAGDEQKIKDIEKTVEERRKTKQAGLTDVQENEARRLKKIIFAEETTVDLHSPHANLYNRRFTISFIAQTAGYMVIQLEGADPFVYENREITGTRKYASMWNAAPLQVKTNGGAFVFEPGFLRFKKTGLLILARTRIGFKVDNALDGDWLITGDWDERMPGVDINFTVQEVAGSETDQLPPLYEFAVEFTSDGRWTPFLYSAKFFMATGERDGTDEVLWNSADHLDILGFSPVLEVTRTFDEDRDATTFQVALRDNSGTLQLPDTRHCLAQLIVDDVSVLKKGVVTLAPRSGMASIGAVPQAGAGSEAKLTIADMWGILDTDTIDEDVDGDGLRAGLLFKTLIRGRGARASEVAGIPSDLGRQLDHAGVGEKPLIQIARGKKRGDALKNIFNNYGTGLYLGPDGNGVWQAGKRSEIVVASFTSAADNHTRFRVHDPVDITEDFSNFYNVFRVEGAKDKKTKKRIVREWVIWPSILQPDHPLFLGYRKPYPTVSDDAYETEDAVMRALMALVKQYGRLGVFRQWKTFWHRDLRPKQRINIDAILSEIVRIPSDSMANDEMEILVAPVA